jgi:hypothetical protein
MGRFAGVAGVVLVVTVVAAGAALAVPVVAAGVEVPEDWVGAGLLQAVRARVAVIRLATSQAFDDVFFCIGNFLFFNVGLAAVVIASSQPSIPGKPSMFDCPKQRNTKTFVS